jgi:dihydroorotase
MAVARRIVITGGRVVDPSQRLDALMDVRIEDGRITELGPHLQTRPDEERFDAGGAVVAPGFIDMHVHLREPGFPEKETIETGTRAARHGGFTAVACMPNTEPALDDVAILAHLRQHIDRTASCRVYPIAAITRGRRGIEPVDFASLSIAGAVAFSDDGTTVANARVLRDAASSARDVAGVFISHCEDEALKGDGVMTEGNTSRKLELPGSPPIAEDAIVARDLLIGFDTGKSWHIAHLSTRGALEIVRYARSRGALVTCEVTPHHLTFTDEDVAHLGTAGKVNPPLRTISDVEALREGVRDGTIDAFATDHAPHTQREKAVGMREAAVGFSALEVAVGAYAAAVPGLPLLRFVELLSTNPARILGVDGGTLARGAVGDVTIFADREWIVDPATFASKGHTTPFAGRRLPRCVLATIVGGDVQTTGFSAAPG